MPITAVMGEREGFDATLGDREKLTTEVLGHDQSEVAAVLFVTQSLSVSQQAQARRNIGITGTGADGYTPVKGVDYFDGKDGEDGKDGYTPIKGVDYFDGQDGKDGYTPIKGVDYFDGQNGQPGKDGKDGYTPVKGIDYFDGKNGVDGKDGQPGKDGSPGKDGADGYSPVRGKDYWTDADKSEMVSAVIAALPVYDGSVTSV